MTPSATWSGLAADLRGAVPHSVTFDAPLSEISRWRIGGAAWALVEPSSAEEASAVLRVVKRHEVPFVIVGETSNILFDSGGFDGVLMRIGPRMSAFTIEGRDIHAQAGVSIPVLARAAAEAGLTGMEHAAGIPGTLGGLVMMNGGSQRKGIGSVVERATCADEYGELFSIDHEGFGFSYRTSSLQKRTAAILDVDLRLDYGIADDIVAEIDGILAERASKFPLDIPNCGSTFLSDPAMYSQIGPPGRAIEEAGLKGLRFGGAEISKKHANFIVNNGGASDSDVLRLIAVIRTTVFERTGFLMDCEVRHLSPKGILRPAHEAAEERWPLTPAHRG